MFENFVVSKLKSKKRHGQNSISKSFFLFCFEKRQVQSRRADSWKSRGPLRRYFTDITLVSEDGRHSAAHSVILAASIPRMRDIHIKNNHYHPLL